MWSLPNRSIALLLLIVLLTAGCGRRVLLRDEFTLAGLYDWHLEDDTYGRTLIADGRLYVQVNEPNTMQYTTLKPDLYENFVVTVDATLLEGSRDSSYGILFRMQQGGAFYRFDVTGRGQYIIERRDPDANWQRFTPSGQWEFSDVINTGLNETNTLRVAANGNSVIFSVNGSVLQTFDGTFDTTYGNGSIALDAGTFSGSNTQVAFDNFVIEEP